EGIANRHAEIALSYAQQHRCFPVGGIGDRALVAPDYAAGPRRAVVRELAVVDGIALAPLGCEVNLPRVTDDAFVASGGGLEPVRKMAAVARPAGAHA